MAHRFKRTSAKEHTPRRTSWLKVFCVVLLLVLLMAAVLAKRLHLWK